MNTFPPRLLLAYNITTVQPSNYTLLASGDQEANWCALCELKFNNPFELGQHLQSVWHRRQAEAAKWSNN